MLALIMNEINSFELVVKREKEEEEENKWWNLLEYEKIKNQYAFKSLLNENRMKFSCRYRLEIN